MEKPDVINSFKPIALNRLDETLLAKEEPVLVKTGKPDHKESLQVV